MAACSQARAATYYVRTDGSNSNAGTGTSTSQAWATVSHAGSSMSAGDVVYVMPGTYNEAVTLSIDGTSGNPIRFIADRDGSVFGTPGNVTISATSGNEAIDIFNDDYIEFYGFRLEGASSAYAVRWENSPSGVLKNCEIFGGGYAGVWCRAGSSLTVTNCLIRNNSADGIYIDGGTLTVRNTTIADNASDGVEQDAGSSTITNTIVYSNSSDGLDLDGGTMNNTYNLVYGNGDLNWEGVSTSTGEISSAPQFVSSSDYHLRLSSPAVNTGANLAGNVDDDFHGNPRPINSLWDMGYHEYGSTNGSTSLLFVTENSGYYTTQERYRKTLFEAWGYAVSAITDSDSQSNYDSALANASVAYVSEEVSSSSVGYKVREASIGVVSEEMGLDTELGIATSDGSEQNSTNQIIVTDNTHQISADLASGYITIFDSTQPRSLVQGTRAADLQELATSSSGNLVLGYIEAGGTLANTYSGNGTASGRRARLPWGGDAFDFATLDDDGLSILKNALEWARGGLVAHWKLDETSGTTAADSSGFGNDGSFSGSPTWSTIGVHDGSLDLETADGVDRIDAGNFDVVGVGLTLMAWVRQEDPLNDGRIIMKSDGNGSSDQSWGLTIDENGELDFRVTAGGTWRRVQAPGVITPNTWHHVTGTYDGTTMRLYLDGELIASSTHSPGGAIVGDSSHTVTLGDSPIGGRPFDGLIDDARVYNRTLNDAEIAYLASGLVGHWKLDENSGTVAVDSSVQMHNGIYTNNPTLNVSGAYPGDVLSAVEFDGVDDHVDLADMNIDFSGGFSVAFWVKPSDTPGTGEYYAFVDLGNGQDVDEIWIGWVDVVGFQLYMTDTADSASLHTIEDNSGFEEGKWVHCVATVDSAGNATLYRNGEVTKSGFNTSIPTNVLRTQNTLGTSVWNDNFPGSLDDVRLYNRPLSAEEVSELYGLMGHWKMDEGTGSTASDSTGFANDATLNGATWTTDCAGNSGLAFDGVNDTATTGSFFDPPERGTVAYWIRSAGPPSSRQRPWGVGADYEMWQDSDGVISFDVSTDGYQGGFITNDPLDMSDRWYHLIAEYDSDDDSYAIYINGELHKSGISTWAMVKQAANTLTFGTRTGNSQYFEGAIRDFRVYNRPLSATEISGLSGLMAYWKLDETSGTVAVDSSPNGNDGTYTNGVLINQTGNIGQAAEFDGVDDYVGVPDDPTLQMDATFSISAWIRTNSSTNVDRMILNKEGEYEIAITPDNVIKWAVRNTDPGWAWHSTGHVVALGKWTHIVMTYDNGSVNTYANGVLVDTYSGSGAVGDQYPSLNELRLGGRSNNPSGKYFDGLIDDVHLYNRVLCPTEIFGQYKGGRPAGIRIIKWLEVR